MNFVDVDLIQTGRFCEVDLNKMYYCFALSHSHFLIHPSCLDNSTQKNRNEFN